ncbi:unnamed protein product [Caenorhabditis brenneri]
MSTREQIALELRHSLTLNDDIADMDKVIDLQTGKVEAIQEVIQLAETNIDIHKKLIKRYKRKIELQKKKLEKMSNELTSLRSAKEEKVVQTPSKPKPRRAAARNAASNKDAVKKTRNTKAAPKTTIKRSKMLKKK